MSGYEEQLHARAEMLEETGELAAAATVILAFASGAGLDPRAVVSLRAAARALIVRALGTRQQYPRADSCPPPRRTQPGRCGCVHVYCAAPCRLASARMPSRLGLQRLRSSLRPPSDSTSPVP